MRPVRPACQERLCLAARRSERLKAVIFDTHLCFGAFLDLPVLARILKAVPQDDIKQMVLAAPTSAPGRRIWYLYELLTGTRLDVPDAPNVAAVNFLDPKSYFTAKPKLSRRHRVRDNLLGTKDFCPIIRRTPALEAHIASRLADSAREVVGRTGGHVIARAASFMLLADSRASFECPTSTHVSQN